ncbi:FecR family protein [Aquincola agrisoli]
MSRSILRRRGAPMPLSAVALAAGLLLPGALRAEPAATVLFASGEARIRSSQGELRQPAKGGLVDSGDTIETGRGRVQLRMIDGAMMSLNEETVLRLDDYRAAGTAGDDERGFMSLVKGGLRTISGSIGKARPERYKLDTPAGTIGIRGTEYSAAVDQGLHVSVFGGRVAVCNDGGCIDVPKGFGAFTPGRDIRPAVSARLAVVVPPASSSQEQASSSGEAEAGGPPTAAAAAAAAPAAPSTVPATAVAPIEGERIARYVATLLSQGPEAVPAPDSPAGDDVLPGLGGGAGQPVKPPGSGAPVTITPAPLPAPAPAPPADPPSPSPAPDASPAPSPAPAPAPIPAPAPSPTPGPSPSPAPAPQPSPPPGPLPPPPPKPSPAPAPTRAPLPNGVGAVALVWTTDKGELGSGLTSGDRRFGPDTGLTELDEAAKHKKIIEKGVVADPGADGIVAWGRWIDGQSKVNDAGGKGKGNLSSLHYVAFVGQPSLPAIGSFTSFASTAPTVASGGRVVATGVANAAGGRVNIALAAPLGGTATYSLTVPVAGQTFSLTGTALQTSTFGFSGISLITSSGSGCASGCTGTLGNGVSVRGIVGGAGNSRLGVTYGFDSRLGDVTGAIVFKP